MAVPAPSVTRSKIQAKMNPQVGGIKITKLLYRHDYVHMHIQPDARVPMCYHHSP